MTQKYFKGDLVKIGDMPKYMFHFPSNCEAIVLYTYKEAYGGGRSESKQYCVYLLPNKGETSWYEEDQLTLIEPDRFDLLPKGNVHRKAYEAKKVRDTK
jgi:hypothetical protein